VTIGVGTAGAGVETMLEGLILEGLVTVTMLVVVDVYVSVLLMVVVGSTTGTTVMVCLRVEEPLAGTVPDTKSLPPLN